MSVNYETKIIPTPSGPITVNPGQRITSLRQIADEVAWYEYGVLKTPNVKTIKTIIDWLESNGQCRVESNSKGTLITIINWGTYNVNGIEKVTDLGQVDETQKKHGPDTNKKEPEKEPIEIKETTTVFVVDKLSVSDVQKLMAKHMRRLTQNSSQVEVIRGMINKFTPEAITRGFENAGSAGAYSLDWVRKNIEGNYQEPFRVQTEEEIFGGEDPWKNIISQKESA
jgi:hypothetical protein